MLLTTEQTSNPIAEIVRSLEDRATVITVLKDLDQALLTGKLSQLPRLSADEGKQLAAGYLALRVFFTKLTTPGAETAAPNFGKILDDHRILIQPHTVAFTESVINRLLIRSLNLSEKLYQGVQDTVVLSTHPSPSQIDDTLALINKLNVPVVLALSDPQELVGSKLCTATAKSEGLVLYSPNGELVQNEPGGEYRAICAKTVVVTGGLLHHCLAVGLRHLSQAAVHEQLDKLTLLVPANVVLTSPQHGMLNGVSGEDNVFQAVDRQIGELFPSSTRVALRDEYGMCVHGLKVRGLDLEVRVFETSEQLLKYVSATRQGEKGQLQQAA